MLGLGGTGLRERYAVAGSERREAEDGVERSEGRGVEDEVEPPSYVCVGVLNPPPPPGTFGEGRADGSTRARTRGTGVPEFELDPAPELRVEVTLPSADTTPRP
jgi:hypothetical protein